MAFNTTPENPSYIDPQEIISGTKAKLEEVKDPRLAVNLIRQQTSALTTEVEKQKITHEQKQLYYKEFGEQAKIALDDSVEREIANSPELRTLDEMVTGTFQKRAKDSEAANGNTPAFIEKIKGIAGIGAMLSPFFLSLKLSVEAKKPEDVSYMDRFLLQIATWLGYNDENKKPDEQTAQANANQPAGQPAEQMSETDKKAVEELAKNSKEEVKSAFGSEGLTLDETSFDKDVLFVYKNGIKAPEEIVAMAKEAAGGKALAALKKHMGDKANQVNVTLKDAYYFTKVFKDTDNQKVADNMSKIAKNDPKKMRGYLDETYKLPGNPDVLAKYVGDLEKGKVNV